MYKTHTCVVGDNTLKPKNTNAFYDDKGPINNVYFVRKCDKDNGVNCVSNSNCSYRDTIKTTGTFYKSSSEFNGMDMLTFTDAYVSGNKNIMNLLIAPYIDVVYTKGNISVHCVCNPVLKTLLEGQGHTVISNPMGVSSMDVLNHPLLKDLVEDGKLTFDKMKIVPIDVKTGYAIESDSQYKPDMTPTEVALNNFLILTGSGKDMMKPSPMGPTPDALIDVSKPTSWFIWVILILFIVFISLGVIGYFSRKSATV